MANYQGQNPWIATYLIKISKAQNKSKEWEKKIEKSWTWISVRQYYPSGVIMN